MLSTGDLHRAVAQVLRRRHLGTPVFVRYQIHSADRGRAVLDRLAQTVAAVAQWLDQRIERIYALGGVREGQITLALEFAAGGTAIVSWTRSPAPGHGIDVMLIGNHGVLYHDFGHGVLWEAPAAPLEDPTDATIVAALDRALRTHRPEPIGNDD